MSLSTFLTFFAAFLTFFGVVVVIFVERKNPASTIAWIMVLIFFPMGGFIAYMMFGSGFHVNQRKKFAAKKISDKVYKRVLSRYIATTTHHEDYTGTPYERMIRYLEHDGNHFCTQDNTIQVFTGGEELFEQMKRELTQAKEHIHLLYYIFRNDTIGKEIIAILTQKAQEGVQVRVLYDSLGSMLNTGHMFQKLRAAGGLVEGFSPLLLNLSSHLRLNYRNHRKITVIDGVIGYVGGMNVGDEYLGRDKKLTPWRDTHLRLTGTSVSFLQERFLMDWSSACDTDKQLEENLGSFFPEPYHTGNLAVQIVSSGPDTGKNSIKNGMLEALYTARRTIYIQTPYFTPDDSFIDALRIAARSGVDIRLMIPALKENYLVHAATYSYAWQMLQYGVKVFMFHGFLHAKTLAFDGYAATIGTANIDNRSFALNFEVNAFIYDDTFAAQQEALFHADMKNCTPLTHEWFAKQNKFTRGIYGFSRLFAPLM